MVTVMGRGGFDWEGARSWRWGLKSRRYRVLFFSSTQISCLFSGRERERGISRKGDGKGRKRRIYLCGSHGVPGHQASANYEHFFFFLKESFEKKRKKGRE